MTEEFTNLIEALNKQFSAEEAKSLAELLSCSCRADSIVYEDIELDDEVKDDIIMIACEERVLLPMKSMRGSAWEDRVLTFTEGERYHMPRIVRFLVEDAQDSGKWNVNKMLEKVLVEAGESNPGEIVDYLNHVRLLAHKYDVEVGVMQTISGELGLEIDMHDALDRFVRCGIMSQCTQKSIHSGFSKYEVNPCLYWKS